MYNARQKTIEQVHDASNLQELMGGCVFVSVKADADRLVFTAEDGFQVLFYHEQDCCESVSIDDICGDLNDLVGTPIVVAEERSNAPEPAAPHRQDLDNSYTWTFYTLRTNKGTVDVRWLGSSNGYYSESVHVEVLHPDYDSSVRQKNHWYKLRQALPC